MRSHLVPLTLLVLFVGSLPAIAGKAPEPQDPPNAKLLVRKPAMKLHVVQQATITNMNYSPSKVVLVMPMPATNEYQDISNVHIGGPILPIPQSEDSYIRFLLKKDDLDHMQLDLTCSYDVTLYETRTDFTRVKKIEPYDPRSPIVAMYTGKCGNLIDPDNPTIKAVGDDLWAKSSNVLDYARRCYDYVASSYRYLNPNTGIHPISKILEDGGGDCGNLSSIFVSLMRHKGIPSRHLVAIKASGGNHVWADFFLEGYGWVPVDVTKKNADRSGDYFGNVTTNADHIILNRTLSIALDLNGETKTVDLLQGHFWWYWGSGDGKMEAAYRVTASPITKENQRPILYD